MQDSDRSSEGGESARPSCHHLPDFLTRFQVFRLITMDSGTKTREYRTLQGNLSKIVDSLSATVDPGSLALKLHEVDLVTRSTVDSANIIYGMTPAQRIRPILTAILAQVELDASKYHSFVTILEQFNPTLAHCFTSTVKPPPIESPPPMPQQSQLSSTVKPPPIESPPPMPQQLQLSVDDLLDVSTYLLVLTKEQVIDLGLVLGLNTISLNPIKYSDRFLDDMLVAWLQGKDQVNKRGGHTWRSLAKGLRHPKVNQTEIADKIESKET